MITMVIENQGKFYQPLLEGKLTWTTERQGAPGIVKFNVVPDGVINFQEGNNLIIRHCDTNIFNGFVFTKARNKKRIISVTAYDQLRYLKNKDTISYEDKTAADVVTMIANDYGLVTGKLADTGHIIASRIEKNKTLFDMIISALNLTLQNKQEMYVLYDNVGKLNLTNIKDMQVDILLNAETGENFDYKSSIDDGTANQIKLYRENKDTGLIDTYVAKHGENINKWGVLQHYESLQDGENGQAKADALLSLMNKKSRRLTVKGAFGDIRVRAGSLIGVSLNLGDIINNTMMLVERCTHTFEKDVHTMDLTLRGGEFDG